MKVTFRGVHTRPVEIEYIKNKAGQIDTIKLNVDDFLGLTADPDFYMTYSCGEFNSIIGESYE